MIKLASYATNPLNSKGRFIKESDENPNYYYLRDCERIIHSVAFRRLEYKTQVFVNHVGDHYRTRLTHTLEVAQVARTICRYLNLNEDLAEAVALSHDLGHPPFGHAGEDGLNESAKEYGGFNHNIHTVKILTKLENRHPDFCGLNLTLETLDGIIKHNGPILGKIPLLIESLSKDLDLRLDKYPSMEAQVANLSDDIAYLSHDIDDGIRAGFFEIEELEHVDLIWKIYKHIKANNSSLSLELIANEFVRSISKFMIDDLVSNTEINIAKHKIRFTEDIYNYNFPLVSFSEPVNKMKIELKNFLMLRLYRNFQVNRMTFKAQRLVKKLFKNLIERPDCLPTNWQLKIKGLEKNEFASIIIDYIAGMTDRYAIEEYKKLFDSGLL